MPRKFVFVVTPTKEIDGKRIMVTRGEYRIRFVAKSAKEAWQKVRGKEVGLVSKNAMVKLLSSE